MTATRWGILATGGIAATFVSDLRLVPDAEVVAVGSRGAAAAERFAVTHGVPRAHGSWQALAEDPDVDVIYVATPHHAHHAATMTCLRAGRPVLTEKPFTVDRTQADELVAKARSGGTFLMEAMWTRCFPAVRRIVELLADGAIGTPTGVIADFGERGPTDPGHRIRSHALAGGALLDLGVYPLSFAQMVLGEPDTIAAWASLGPEGTDENTAMILGYGSGAVASLTCSIVGNSPRRAAIAGTAGRIEVPTDFFRPAGFTLFRSGREPEPFDFPYEGSGYHFEAAEIQRCLREGLTESPLVPLDDTLAIMSTLDAVRAQIGVDYA